MTEQEMAEQIFIRSMTDGKMPMEYIGTAGGADAVRQFALRARLAARLFMETTAPQELSQLDDVKRIA